MSYQGTVCERRTGKRKAIHILYLSFITTHKESIGSDGHVKTHSSAGMIYDLVFSKVNVSFATQRPDSGFSGSRCECKWMANFPKNCEPFFSLDASIWPRYRVTVTRWRNTLFRAATAFGGRGLRPPWHLTIRPFSTEKLRREEGGGRPLIRPHHPLCLGTRLFAVPSI